MSTDTEVVKSDAVGLISSALAVNVAPGTPSGQANVNAILEIQKQRRQIYIIQKAAADGTAATTTAETTGFLGTTAKCRVYQVTFTPTSGGLTADPSNFATVSINARPVAGGASVAVATLTTTVASSGSLTQDVRKAFVLSAGVDLLDAQEFTLQIAKSGTGVVVPAGYFTIFAEDT